MVRPGDAPRSGRKEGNPWPVVDLTRRNPELPRATHPRARCPLVQRARAHRVRSTARGRRILARCSRPVAGALLICKDATSATGRSNPRAQGRLPGRGVGPGWGTPGASPKHPPKGRRRRRLSPQSSRAGARRRVPPTRAPRGRRAQRWAPGNRALPGRGSPAPPGSRATPSARSSPPSAASSPASWSSPRIARAGAPQCYPPVSLALMIPAVCRRPPLPERRPALSTIYPGSRHDASPTCATGRRTRGARSAPRPGPAPLVRTLSYPIGTPRVDGPARRVCTAAHASGGRVRPNRSHGGRTGRRLEHARELSEATTAAGWLLRRKRHRTGDVRTADLNPHVAAPSNSPKQGVGVGAG
jgi:hypothetical protein